MVILVHSFKLNENENKKLFYFLYFILFYFNLSNENVIYGFIQLV